MAIHVKRLFSAVCALWLLASCAGNSGRVKLGDAAQGPDGLGQGDQFTAEAIADLGSADSQTMDAQDTGPTPDLSTGWQCLLAEDCLPLGPPPLCELYQCTPDHQCITATAPDGEPCTPTAPCFVDGTCVGGQCVGETPATCNDDNPCTEDSCDPEKGCLATPVDGTCDDGDKCTEGDTCVEGICAGTAVTCADDNPCTTDGCDPLVGCLFTNQEGACDDGDPCTGQDVCVGGVCTGQDDLCQCASDEDCAGALDDPCSATATCVMDEPPFYCAVTPVACPASPTVCATAQCDSDSGGCVLVPANAGDACDDPLNCVTGGTCDQGKCVGPPLNCDDDNACTADSCVAGEGCLFEPTLAPCDDGDACTINDFCTEAGACVGLATGCQELPVLAVRLTSLVIEKPGFCLPSPVPGGDCVEATALVNSFIKDDLNSAESPLVMLGLFDPFDLTGELATFALGPGECSFDAEGQPDTCSFVNPPAQLAPVIFAKAGTCTTASQTATAPCFQVTGEGLEVGIMDIVIPVSKAQVTGAFLGMPAPAAITDGHIEAFLLKSVADAINVTLPLMPPYKLSDLMDPGSLTQANGLLGWPLLVHFAATAVPDYAGE